MEDNPLLPWYESNLLWVPVSLGFGILLAVVAAMKHDLCWLLWFAWAFFVLAVWAISRRNRYVLVFTILGAAVLGLALWGTKLLVCVPTSQAASISNPESGSKAPVPQSQTTNNCPNGICISGGTVTNPVVNNGSPSLRIAATTQMQHQTGDSTLPYTTTFTISTNVAAEIGDLRLRCSAPALQIGMERVSAYELISGNNGPDPHNPDVVVYQVKPETLVPNRPIKVVVYSKTPIRVISGTANGYPISFRPQR